MNDLTTTDYIEPYPQDALDGELGLTAKDIALAMNVDIKKIRKKLRRDKWHTNKVFRSTPYGTLNENGVKYTEYALNIRTAQAFVARWVNSAGDGYLDYLFDCEEKYKKQIPILLEHIEKLEKKFMRPRKTKKYVHLHTYKKRIDMFGNDDIQIHTEKKLREDLTTQEESAYTFTHIVKIQEGLAKRQLKSIASKEIIPVCVKSLNGGHNDLLDQ